MSMSKQIDRERASRSLLGEKDSERLTDSVLKASALAKLETRAKELKPPIRPTMAAILTLGIATEIAIRQSDKARFPDAVRKLAKAIQEAEKAEQISKEMFKLAVDRIKNQTTKVHRIEAGKDLKSLWFTQPSIEDEEAQKLAAGLLDALIDLNTLIVKRKVNPGTKKERVYLDVHPKAAEIVGQIAADSAVRQDLPLLCAPHPWVSPKIGGYWTYERDVMVMQAGAKLMNAVEFEKANEHIRGLNRLQETAWEINEDNLNLLKWVRINEWEHRLGKKAMLPLEKRSAQTVAAQECVVQIANKFRDTEFWFSWNLDFRGRLNAVGALTPQKAHWVKALLRFSSGREIGPEGFKWLSLHAANCAGEDKLPLGKAFVWAKENWDLVVKVATKPRDHFEAWCGFDDPLGFVATCKELVDADLIGPKFKSKISVGLDASCSGSQIMAARNRDPHVGYLTNLTPNETKADLYRTVVDKTAPRLVALAHDPMGEAAARWLTFGWDRSVVKRAVLASPYGATRYGMATMLREDTINDARTHFGEWGGECATLGSQLIYKGIDDGMPQSALFRDCIRDHCAYLAKEGKHLEWRLPTGLLVKQRYFGRISRRLKYKTTGKRADIVLVKATKEIDEAGSVNGSSPNVVHSIDAALAVRTALSMPKDAPLWWVHDSFGSTPDMMDTLYTNVRREFVKMFEEWDPLEAVFDRSREQGMSNSDLVKMSTKVPEKENLDLKGVLDSPFFFR